MAARSKPASAPQPAIATVTIRFGGQEFTATGASLLAAAFEAAGKAAGEKEGSK